MKLDKLTPLIYTSDVKETIGFYVITLGFTCLTGNPVDWAILQCDNISLMISKPNEHLPFERPIFTGSFYFHTGNVDGIWEKVKDQARVCYPIDNFEYGMREFAIYDNNGYLLQFGQEL